MDLFLFRTFIKIVPLHIFLIFIFIKRVSALQCNAMQRSFDAPLCYKQHILLPHSQSAVKARRVYESVFDHASAKIQFHVSYLGPQLLYFRGELLALLRVLPLGRLFALHDLQEVQVLLLQLLLLQQQLVEAETHKQIGAAQISAGGFN